METYVKFNPRHTKLMTEDENTKELFTKNIEVSTNNEYKMKFESYGPYSVFVNILPNKKETTVDDILSHNGNFDEMCRKLILVEKILLKIEAGSDGDRRTLQKMRAFLNGDAVELNDRDISRLMWMAAKPY